MVSFSNEFYAKKVGSNYTTYPSKDDAFISIPLTDRTYNMVINVDWKEYEWKYGLANSDLTVKKVTDVNRLSADETLLLISSSRSEPLPSGSERHIMSFDENGRAIAKPMTANMWSDFPNGAPTEGDWFAAYSPSEENPVQLGFFKAAWPAEANSVPLRGDYGQLKVGDALEDSDAVNAGQLPGFVSNLLQYKLADLNVDPLSFSVDDTLLELIRLLKS